MISLFESIILEDRVRDLMVPEDGRTQQRNFMLKLRHGGTIDINEVMGGNTETHNSTSGWTNDASYRQPSKYIEPTENGYPGLEPPVG